MNEFNKQCISIKENSIKELQEQYESMLKEHQQYLNQRITKLFKEQLEIKNLIDKEFMIETKFNGIRTINELSESLDELTKIIILKTYDKEPDKKELFSLYFEKFKKTIQENQMEWIEKIIEDFIYENFIKKNKELSNSPEQNKIIINKIKELMKEYRNKFIKDYNEIQKDFVNKMITQIGLLINESDFIKLRTFEYERFSELLTLSNYQLIEENRIFYAKNKSNSQKLELFLDKGTLKSKDNKLKFVIDERKSTKGFINNETKQRIVIQKENNELEKINLTSVKNNILITIYKKEGNYNFEKNLKSITDTKEIKLILIEIRDNYPGIFNKLIYDRDIKPIVNKIIEYNKLVSEMIKKRNKDKSLEQLSTKTEQSIQNKTKKKV